MGNYKLKLALSVLEKIDCLQENDSCIPPYDPSHDPLFVCCGGLECKEFERRNTLDFVVGICLPQGNENETGIKKYFR